MTSAASADANPLELVREIARDEGIGALWAGVGPKVFFCFFFEIARDEGIGAL